MTMFLWAQIEITKSAEEERVCKESIHAPILQIQSAYLKLLDTSLDTYSSNKNMLINRALRAHFNFLIL